MRGILTHFSKQRPDVLDPEEARKLLEAATPGPWLCVGEDDEYPRVARVGYMDITNDAEHYNARLIAAAPDLAAIVAGLRYEYAVQKLDGNEWKLTDLDGRALESYETEKVTWWADPIPYSDIADRGPGWRIVRRLVGEPEVAE